MIAGGASLGGLPPWEALRGHGVQKKKDELEWADIQIAASILNENDQVEKKKRE